MEMEMDKDKVTRSGWVCQRIHVGSIELGNRIGGRIGEGE